MHLERRVLGVPFLLFPLLDHDLVDQLLQLGVGVVLVFFLAGIALFAHDRAYPFEAASQLRVFAHLLLGHGQSRTF